MPTAALATHPAILVKFVAVEIALILFRQQLTAEVVEHLVHLAQIVVVELVKLALAHVLPDKLSAMGNVCLLEIISVATAPQLAPFLKLVVLASVWIKQAMNSTAALVETNVLLDLDVVIANV